MFDIDKKSVGARIKSIRKSKGMTLEEFGKLFGASKSSVSGWEKGDNIPNNERLKQIAKIGDLSVSELQYGDFKTYIATNLSQFLAEIMPDYNVVQDDFEQALNNIYSEAITSNYSYNDIEPLQASFIARTAFIRDKYTNLDILLKDVSDKDIINLYIERLSDVQTIPAEFEESEVLKHSERFSKNNCIVQDAIDKLKKDLIEKNSANFVVSEPIKIFYTSAAKAGPKGFGYDDYDSDFAYTNEEPPRYDIATKVNGDSMNPDYQDGDILYLRDYGTTSYDGDECVIVINDKSYFKKLYSIENGLRLVSLNPNKELYPDIEIEFPPSDGDHIKIFNVVGSFTPIDNK